LFKYFTIQTNVYLSTFYNTKKTIPKIQKLINNCVLFVCLLIHTLHRLTYIIDFDIQFVIIYLVDFIKLNFEITKQ